MVLEIETFGVMQEQTMKLIVSTPETLTEGDLSTLIDGELVEAAQRARQADPLDGAIQRARQAALAASPTFRSRVLTYGPDAAILVLRSFDDFLGLLDLIDRGIVEIVMNEE